ncbi:MAG TPA: iron chelate uptake ABC transporter family permease subunit [Thermomicrobiales bacterium]|nr:iron chelate uptake ABC transporter family permease subunit [Thermomicrobiales bacterium]
MATSTAGRLRPAPTHDRARPIAWTGPAARLTLLTGIVLAVIAVFMTIESRGNWDFILPFRGRKVLALIVVGYAIAASTVLFQTITANRILTPSIMGFDALYLLIQTVAVFALGSGRLIQADPRLRFGVEVTLMVVFAGALYWWLFVKAERSLPLLVLVGIIFGVMFRSVTELLQRLIDPTEFAVLQDIGFASFNTIDQTLLTVSTALIAAVSLVLWRMNRQLDAMALGQDIAISLGIDYHRVVLVTLALVTVLVAVSTALVGPITFFGLLVAHLAYLLAGSQAHRWVVPAATLFAVLVLISGQMILERVFTFNSSLSVIIEFAGGIVFILLLIRGSRR